MEKVINPEMIWAHDPLIYSQGPLLLSIIYLSSLNKDKNSLAVSEFTHSFLYSLLAM